MIKNILYKVLCLKGRKQPLINVLTRTSGRPIGFRKCHESIENQTYKNVRHIVSYDDQKDLAYLNLYKNVEKFKVLRLDEPPTDETPPLTGTFEPYNLYCNQLLNEVKDGWVMFLDDDDMLADEKVLERIVANILKKGKNTLYFWQTQFPNEAVLPPDKEFKQRKIVFEHIDTACFIFHSKFKDLSQWDSWYAADYRFIEGLAKHIPKQKWIPEIFTLKNNFGDRGRRNDIKE